MTTLEMRTAISKVYPGLSWQNKVANMPEGQVIAVYLSFERTGAFKRDLKKYNKPYKDKQESKTKSNGGYGYKVEQITIDEILAGE